MRRAFLLAGVLANVLANVLALGPAGAAPATMANPAAAFCAEHGGQVEIETVPNGAQKGVCVFADGRRIDEWVYFRNAHRTTEH